MQKGKKELISLDEIFVKAHYQKKDFIKELESEEKIIDFETEETIKNEILGDKINSVDKKQKFINEIKSGLGEEIRKNKGVIVIKKSWYVKFIDFIKNILTKF